MVLKTRIKGNRNVNKCIDLLSIEGYYVDKVEKTGRFIKQKDLYGLFDLIGIQRINNETEVILAQVTSNVPHTHYRFEAFAEKFGSDTLRIMQYVWVDREGFKIFNYNKGKQLVAKGVSI